MSKKMIQGEFEEGDAVAVKVKDGELVLEKVEDKAGTVWF